MWSTTNGMNLLSLWKNAIGSTSKRHSLRNFKHGNVNKTRRLLTSEPFYTIIMAATKEMFNTRTTDLAEFHGDEDKNKEDSVSICILTYLLRYYSKASWGTTLSP